MGVSPRRVGITVIGLMILGLLGLMALGQLVRTPVTGKSGFTRVQKPAPEFTIPLLDGGELNLSQHRGQPIVINFWASWCPPCREEAPLLERTWRSYKYQDVLFVGVNIQDTEEDARVYLKAFDITYPNGVDRYGKVTVDYGVIGLPVTFFVDRDGIVERRWVGAVKESQMVTWVEELVAGVAPSGEAEGENLGSFFDFENTGRERQIE